MKNTTIFLLLCLGIYTLGWTQDKGLPRQLTKEEKALIPAYVQYLQQDSRGIPTPPPFSNLRSMGEWEEIQALVVTWTQYIPTVREIVRHAKKECEVIIVCSDSNSVKSNLTINGITLNNITFLENSFNSIWIRDYGATSVYANDVDSLLLVEWIYNRPRPLDDQVPDAYGNLLGIPVYSTTTPPYDLVHTGGNYMSDGFGTAFSSRLVVEENGVGGQFNPTVKTEAEVDNVMNQFMGIDRYIKMNNLPYDIIHHIDMHMKLLDEETLLVGEYPPNTADGPFIEANIQYVLSNFQSMYGTPYEVVRIQMPPDATGRYPDEGPSWNRGDYRTYTNSVFVNNTLLVPVYEEQYDTTALRILREQLPGYKVIGIDCNDIIGASGALHCITRAVGVADPLLISHQHLKEVYNPGDYRIDALIKHKTDIANALVYYATDTTQGYTGIPMTLIDSTLDIWSADIPQQPQQSEIFYFIHATANSGKQQTRPMPAPKGYWKFRVAGATAIEDEWEKDIQLGDMYPNPSSNWVYLPYKLKKNEQVIVELKDVLGRDMELLYNGMLPAGEKRLKVDISHYASGTYFVIIATENGTQTRKFVKY